MKPSSLCFHTEINVDIPGDLPKHIKKFLEKQQKEKGYFFVVRKFFEVCDECCLQVDCIDKENNVIAHSREVFSVTEGFASLYYSMRASFELTTFHDRKSIY